MRILIIDDNRTDSDLLKKLLKRRFDAEVFQAFTMREGYQIAEADNLDCVIQDLQLPDSSIEQTLSEHITKFPYPVFVYTGFDDPTYRERALDAGAEDFITKATGGASIIERIGHLQYKRHGEKQLIKGAYDARHAEPREKIRTEWKGTIPRLLAAVISVIMFVSGLFTGTWALGKAFGSSAENSKQHFEKLDSMVEQMKRAGDDRDKLIYDLASKTMQGVTERESMRDSMKQNNDMVIDWLKRIEVQLRDDRRK